MSFLDLSNALGSVFLMQLIPNILYHVQLPDQLYTYVTNIFTQMTGIVMTEKWHTPIASKSNLESSRVIPYHLRTF